LHDSLQTELYVQDYSPLRYASRMQHFILSTQELDATTGLKDDAVSTRRLPGWAWFTWLMLGCTVDRTEVVIIICCQITPTSTTASGWSAPLGPTEN
jgi:hypothetical protein